MTTHVMTQTTSSGAAQSSATRTAGRHVAPAGNGNGMNGELPTGANHILHTRVLNRAIQALESTYAAVDPATVRSAVHAAYRELNRTARLKTYLPTLALRQAEDHLRRLAAPATAHPTEHGGMIQTVPAAA